MACSGCTRRTLWSGKGALAPVPATALGGQVMGSLALGLPHAARSVLTFPNETERENVDGQEKADEKADIADRGPLRRAEKIAGAQNRCQIHRAKTHQGQGSQEGSQDGSQDQGGGAAGR